MDRSSYVQNTNRRTDLMNELTVAGGRVGGTVREFGVDVYTLLYLKCVAKALLDSKRPLAQCYGAAWTGGELGEDAHMCVCGCPSETVTTLSVGYIPI